LILPAQELRSKRTWLARKAVQQKEKTSRRKIDRYCHKLPSRLLSFSMQKAQGCRTKREASPSTAQAKGAVPPDLNRLNAINVSEKKID
jgi:hypothetical protein